MASLDEEEAKMPEEKLYLTCALVHDVTLNGCRIFKW